MVKLLVLDLDGTLFNSKTEISERNRQAVLAAQHERKVRVAVASGRSYFALTDLCETLALEQNKGFVIGNNGQDLYDFEKGTLIKGEKIPLFACKATMKIGKARNCEVFAHNNQISMFYSPKKGEKLYAEKERRCYNEMTGYFEEENDLDKIGLFLAKDRNDAYEIVQEIQEAVGKLADVVLVNKTCIELVPHGMDKVIGIDQICKLYDFKKDEVLVLGDGQNDLGMAKKYPFVAMSNALDEVKEKAIRETLSNDEDGVAFEIERTILN